MDTLLWITVLFILIGFAVLISMKRRMVRKAAYVKANRESDKNAFKVKSVIWWIISTTAWGVVCMFLVAWLYYRIL